MAEQKQSISNKKDLFTPGPNPTSPFRQTPNPKDGGYNDYQTGVSQVPPGSKK